MKVTLTLDAFWQVKNHPHLKVTRCKKLINTKTSRPLKYTTKGFFVGGTYIKRNEINGYLEKIPIEQDLPF